MKISGAEVHGTPSPDIENRDGSRNPGGFNEVSAPMPKTYETGRSGMNLSPDRCPIENPWGCLGYRCQTTGVCDHNRRHGLL